MRSFTVFTFLISFSLLSFSQSDFRPGYVITNDDDTLTGFIDYRGDDYNSVNCYFRPTMEDSRILYAPGEIKSYKFLDGRLYVSKQVEIDKVMRDVFLEQLVKGRANLYALAPGVVAGRTDRYAHSTKLFFIETEEKGIQVLENTESLISGKDGSGVLMDNQFVEYSKKYVKEGNEYIGYLKLYFQDQFQLMDEVDRVEFNQNDLIDITTKYHELACPGEACIVYSKPGPEYAY